MDTFFKSPNGRISAKLHQPRTYTPSDKTLDALPYFRTIWLTDLRYSGRFFTGPALWSTNNCYFAVEEWVVPEGDLEQASRQRDRRLVVFDVANTLEVSLDTAAGGQLQPASFDDNLLICQRHLPGVSEPQKLTYDMQQISGWLPTGELSDAPA